MLVTSAFTVCIPDTCPGVEERGGKTGRGEGFHALGGEEKGLGRKAREEGEIWLRIRDNSEERGDKSEGDSKG